MPNFPWDKLKAESLRGPLEDGANFRPCVSHTLVRHIQLTRSFVTVERALKHEKEIYEAKLHDKAQASTESSSIRRSSAVVSDYGTRQKRNRMSDPRPVRSRRKSSRALAAESEETKPKRRARPSKSKPKSTSIFKKQATVPLSMSTREIFDGVVITAPRSIYMKAKETAPADDGRDEDMAGMEDAEGDVDMGHEDDDLILDTVVESSLASSNKENESIHGEVSEEDEQETIELRAEEDTGATPSNRGTSVPTSLQD
ncbi:hypothetical protein H0H87_001952 [Tephrocybe sp. NHM501043]|nr:hypothetical protein H0H87_001952 [Tephrocybe sp. NHM501043]